MYATNEFAVRRYFLTYLAQIISAVYFFLPLIVNAAVNCTVNGYMKYEPVDYYYCDTTRFTGASGVPSCSGWLEIDLDTKRSSSGTAAPLKYVRIEIRNSSGTLLGFTHTNSTGWYSKTVSMPGTSCRNQSVTVRRVLQRVHESDISVSTPRYRFKVVDMAFAVHNTNYSLTLTGSSTTSSKTYPASATSEIARAFAIYYTMNSAMTEAVRWSTNIGTGLASANSSAQFQVVIDALYTDGSYYGWSSDKRAWLRYADYRDGFNTRHEFGHKIHQVMHYNKQTDRCYDDTYNGVDYHATDSCECGFYSTGEAMAHFIAARSITSADTNAWACSTLQISSFAQDECSRVVVGRVGDSNSDGEQDLSGNYAAWFIIGDTYANSKTRCIVPNSTWGCPCGGSGEPTCTGQTAKDNLGFRNSVNVARFFWDIIDTNNESSKDDTDLTMGTFVAAVEGMTCSGTADGSCNEPNTSPCTAARKEKYNSYDFGDLISGDQAAERTLNCVAAAQD